MKKFPFLRRPLKLILYGFLFALITTAALIFAWQYVLDGLALDYSLRNYAYIATVYDEYADEPLLQLLPSKITQQISDSKHVDFVDLQQIRGGKLLDAKTIPEHMMTTQQLNQHYFVEAVIIQDHSRPQDTPVREEIYTARLQQQWGASNIAHASITICLTRLAEEPGWESGDHIFVIGNYIVEHNAVKTTEMEVISPGAAQLFGMNGSILADNPYTVLPKDLTAAESKEYILHWMEETDVAPLYERYAQLGQNVTIKTVQDMSMVSYMANGRFYIADGRPLYETDDGKKVCVISQGLSLRNRLRIGDTITLAIADSGYMVSDQYDIAGYESGFPMEDEGNLLMYPEGESYEIVGIFNQLSKDRNDPFFLTQNDIFIPSAGGMSFENARPYTFSFRILGPDMDGFMAEFQEELEAQGYAFSIIDAGWEDVADSFYAMKDRRTMMFICAVAAFLVAVVLIVVLIQQNFRFEYGVMRLLGAYQKEAFRTYVAGFLFCTLPGVVISAGAGSVVYTLWLREAISSIVPVAVPSNFCCMMTLLGWAMGESVVAFLLLCVVVKLSERNRLLKLIH